MLRDIFVILVHSDNPHAILENKRIIGKLTAEQHIALKSAIEKNTTLAYLELAYTFEHNGDPKEHASKLEALFFTPTDALKYLLRFANKYPENNKFVHDACLFSVPENIKVWKKLALQSNARLLLDPELKLILSQSSDIEKQIIHDKKNHQGIMKSLFTKYDTDSVHILQQVINSKISKINKFCKSYERQVDKHQVCDEIKYEQSLAEREVYYGELACLRINEPLKQWSYEQLRHYYARFRSISGDNIKGYFYQNGLSEKNYKHFLTLDRQNAGKNIPDILLDGKAMGFDGFYLRKLDVQNIYDAALAACLGKLTNCCQSVSGEAGQPCALHGLTSPNGGFYVLCKGDVAKPHYTDTIYAQSWVWKGKQGAIVFDSIEVAKCKEPYSYVENIAIKMYRQLAFQLVHEYNIPAVHCGARSGISKLIGYNNITIDDEIPLDYIGYRDSLNQLFLAHSNSPYNFESSNQSLESIYIDELKSQHPITHLKKLNFTLALALALNRLDAMDYLISLAKRYRLDSVVNYILQTKQHKELLEIYKRDKSTSKQYGDFLRNPKSCYYANIYAILAAATEHDDPNIIKFLIEKIPDIFKQMGLNDDFYLVYVVKHAQQHIVELLVNYKDTVIVNDEILSELIKFSIFNLKNPKILKSLIKFNPALIRKLNLGGSLLIEAARDGLSEIVEVLIDESSEVQINDAFINAVSSYRPNLQTLEILLTKGNASINAKLVCSERESALHAAIRESNYKIIKYLLEYKRQAIDINIKDCYGESPIFYVSRDIYLPTAHERLKIFNYLLMQKGIDINLVNNDGCNILMKLIDTYYQWLTDNDRDLAKYREIFKEMIESLLIKRKPNLSITDNDGNTALMHALEPKKQPAIWLLEILLNRHKNVNINAVNNRGETALSLAAYAGSLNAVSLLLQHGADPKSLKLNKCSDEIKSYVEEWKKFQNSIKLRSFKLSQDIRLKLFFNNTNPQENYLVHESKQTLIKTRSNIII